MWDNEQESKEKIIQDFLESDALKKIKYSLMKKFPTIEENDLDETIQESALKLFKNAHKYDPAYKTPYNYFYTMAKNECLTFLKRKKIKIEYQDYQTPYHHNFDTIELNNFIFNTMLGKIQNLNEQEGEILFAHYILGLSHKELSRYFEKNIGNINVIIHRGKGKLYNIFPSNISIDDIKNFDAKLRLEEIEEFINDKHALEIFIFYYQNNSIKETLQKFNLTESEFENIIKDIIEILFHSTIHRKKEVKTKSHAFYTYLLNIMLDALQDL